MTINLHQSFRCFRDKVQNAIHFELCQRKLLFEADLCFVKMIVVKFIRVKFVVLVQPLIVSRSGSV